MTLTAQQKAERNMALNKRELAEVSGYSRREIGAMGLPLFHGKIRLEDFWRHVAKATYVPPSTFVHSHEPLHPEVKRDLRSSEDTPCEPDKRRGPSSSLQRRAEALLRGSALRTLPA